MDIEVREVRDFLATHAPWEYLPSPALDALASELAIRYYRRGTRLYGVGDPNNTVHIVRSGGVDLRDAQEQLVERLGPGGVFGASSVLTQTPSNLSTTAIEDSLVLIVPTPRFLQLVSEHEEFRRFFEATSDARLRRGADRRSQSQTGEVTLGRTVESFLGREPIAAPSTVSIQQAAQIMAEHKVSALLLVDHDRLTGIVTDRDLRSKVVAQARPVDGSVSEVMTPDPITIGPEARAFEVLLDMTSRGFHHLPVVRDGKVLGLVSAGDVMRLDRAHPIYLAADIGRQNSPEGVAEVCRRTPRLVAEYIHSDASAREISRLLGSINESATRRLITLAEQELGPAPAPWAWVVLGSQARLEAGLGSDQDHAIILHDSAADLDAEQRGWWPRLAERVVAGLEASGYPRCDGDVMATTWCHTTQEWQQHFATWLNTPASQEVLYAQIFFDMRAIHGATDLAEHLMEVVTRATPGASRFLAHLATQAVAASPPLGFFKGFVLERGGEHADTLDLKSSSHAIIQIARTHALALGSTETGTEERLRLASASHKIAPDLTEALIDASEFINHLRLTHQADEVSQGRKPNNRIAPKALNALDKRTLKEAFEVISRAQRALSHTYSTHLMS
ncbi:DUF294 nucleotidyltransferase-like domain-containing protein [Aestuariimicrobium sp. p3-SID1156]|uniref:DUF294 nucleotidyltransferase-like domain-containing protein n=1 Tax=Aestuariimicrobium sp. p3-SID1156 TaxID=2916038 RepID=UPI00223AED74|nr:DUF294 nucleotidyltransferase-like domain-containing protein [Aestuariimicrobium sp. p3-SID1156]MCT1460116.1 DUF294 nucleotidyltransferase-like domain-containing protein [Aestuariimicrobium sp. p3-SID1156]